MENVKMDEIEIHDQTHCISCGQPSVWVLCESCSERAMNREINKIADSFHVANENDPANSVPGQDSLSAYLVRCPKGHLIARVSINIFDQKHSVWVYDKYNPHNVIADSKEMALKHVAGWYSQVGHKQYSSIR
jgi:hypothetical protein